MSDQTAEEQIPTNQPLDGQEDVVAAVQEPVSQPMQRVIAMIMGLVLLLCLALWGLHSLRPADPYIQNVLQLTGDVERGHDIFQLNCATCHGLEAAGEVGPNLQGVSSRKSKSALIVQVISGQTPPMPQFQPSERDMADLLAFLETL